MRDLVLVTGGIRSGKTAFAMSLLVHRFGNDWLYWATGKALDAEMEERIARHRKERPEGVMTLEAGLREGIDSGNLAGEETWARMPVLLDSLGFCVLETLSEADITVWMDRLSELVAGRPGPVVVVSEEVGWGGISMDRSARLFADRLGLWNQRLAREAGSVYAVMAGCPLRIR
ncbi:MAG: bifunctional adenosylcobinamide kinase/adenosylcobinamide-phosphate guanylyltransferase [Nitrospirae bacterium]|uniref:Adenosylcobinamide kinase n=1 Tax=Leptospirillum ferrodiazotrophum TaxID=412449 RepID=C6I043_9BACT|nr:MAG: cobalbumin biosynthesis enzyme CobU [Leptospirillum ferrodiazotrophum]MCL5953693.1 bifunctional adenosylcobinamide kinase/adenosylcobinamide-phosphate guanylyltransferase [Nitrospirota bacterium]